MATGDNSKLVARPEQDRSQAKSLVTDALEVRLNVHLVDEDLMTIELVNVADRAVRPGAG